MNEHIEYACLIDGQRVDDTGRMRALVLEEAEGTRSPPSDPIGRFEEVRDSGRFMQVKRLQAEQLKYMSAVEKRLLKDWIVAQTDEFDRKATLIERNMGADIPVPDYYLEKAI